LKRYKPGKSGRDIKQEVRANKYIKLSSNENPLGPSPLAIKALKNTIYEINRYPDASGINLRKKLAKNFNVTYKNVVIGSGSEGIMSTIMRTFLLSDDEIISSAGSFIGFRVLANASGRKVHWVPMKNHHYNLKQMAEKINDYTKIVYIANPDNPMGTYINKYDFDEFYSSIPDRVLIILDEAYHEFVSNEADYPDSMHYRYDNVITLRTFSKAYGLGGLRLGYGFAHEKLIENLNKVKPPFEPSLPAQQAGIAALDDKKFLNKTLENNNIGMAFLKNELQSLGITYIPSYTNFITTIWENEKTAEKIASLLLNKGIIIRQLNSFGWNNCIRISIGLEKENRKFAKTLRKIL